MPLTKSELIQGAVDLLETTSFSKPLSETIELLNEVFDGKASYRVQTKLAYDERTGLARVSSYDCGFLFDRYETDDVSLVLFTLLYEAISTYAYDLVCQKQQLLQRPWDRIVVAEKLAKQIGQALPEPYGSYFEQGKKPFGLG